MKDDDEYIGEGTRGERVLGRGTGLVQSPEQGESWPLRFRGREERPAGLARVSEAEKAAKGEVRDGHELKQT